MKVLLTCLHNRTWNPRSGSYCGPDPGANGSEKMGSVAGMRKMRSSWVKGRPPNTQFSQTKLCCDWGFNSNSS